MDLSFPNIVPDIFAMISSILSSGIGTLVIMAIAVYLGFFIMEFIVDKIWGERYRAEEQAEDDARISGLLNVKRMDVASISDRVHKLGRTAERAVSLRRRYEKTAAGPDTISVND